MPNSSLRDTFPMHGLCNEGLREVAPAAEQERSWQRCAQTRARHTVRHGVLGEGRAPTRDAGGTRAVPLLGEGHSSAASEEEEGWHSAVAVLCLTSAPFPPSLPSSGITIPPARRLQPAQYAEERRGPALTALLSPSSVRWSSILPAAGEPCSSCSMQAVLGSEELFWWDRCAPGRRPSLPPAGPSQPAAGSGRRPGGGPLPWGSRCARRRRRAEPDSPAGSSGSAAEQHRLGWEDEKTRSSTCRRRLKPLHLLLGWRSPLPPADGSGARGSAVLRSAAARPPPLRPLPASCRFFHSRAWKEAAGSGSLGFSPVVTRGSLLGSILLLQRRWRRQQQQSPPEPVALSPVQAGRNGAAPAAGTSAGLRRTAPRSAWRARGRMALQP